MNIFKPLTTPEYLFRPSQILRRFKRAWQGHTLEEFAVVQLPWGSPIRIRPNEVIGGSIYCYGVFDLVVTEAISRLLDRSETAVDIGANIGQMTSLMRQKVGPKGKVIAFEPHPELFRELQYNVEMLSNSQERAAVELHNAAVGAEAGEAFLDVGAIWSKNRGLSKVVNGNGSEASKLIPIEVVRLDSVLDSGTQVHFCKLDVEGFELNVLKGASALLAGRTVRDLVFEDFGEYPGIVHRLLLAHGFTLFSLHSRLRGPLLLPAADRASFKAARDGLNYLATLAPERALARFKQWGWATLR